MQTEQVLHKSQLDDRQQLTCQCSHVDDMYESLAAHEQKVPTKDQVKHEDLTNELANFQNQLVLVSAVFTECRQLSCAAWQAVVCNDGTVCCRGLEFIADNAMVCDAWTVCCRAWSSLLTTRRSRAGPCSATLHQSICNDYIARPSCRALLPACTQVGCGCCCWHQECCHCWQRLLPTPGTPTAFCVLP